jgi:hypothetical protein
MGILYSRGFKKKKKKVVVDDGGGIPAIMGRVEKIMIFWRFIRLALALRTL